MTYPPQQGMPGDPGQQPYGQQPDPFAQQPDPYAQQPDPYGQQPQFGAVPPAPAGPSPIQLGPGMPTPPPRQSKLPWIVAGITSLIAVGSLVAAIIMVAGDEPAESANESDPSETETKAQAAYELTEEICGDLDESKWESVMKVEDLEGYPNELHQMRCSATAEDYEAGLRIVVGTDSDASEAEKSYEQLKGDLYETSGLEDVDGDWDQAEVLSDDYGRTVMLVQDANLYYSIEMTVKDGKPDELEEAATAIAKDMLKQVSAGK